MTTFLRGWCAGATALIVGTTGCTTTSSPDEKIEGPAPEDGTVRTVALTPGRAIDLLEAVSDGGLWVLSHDAGSDGESNYFAQRLGDDASIRCEANVGSFSPSWTNYGIAPDGALVFGTMVPGEGRRYRAVRFDPSSCKEAEWFVDPDFDGYNIYMYGRVAVSETAMFFAGGDKASFTVEFADGPRRGEVVMMPTSESLRPVRLGDPVRLTTGQIVYTVLVPMHFEGDDLWGQVVPAAIQMALVDPKTAKVTLSESRNVLLPEDRTAFGATIVPQPGGAFFTFVRSSPPRTSRSTPVRSYVDVFGFDFADDAPITAWQNMTLSYPPPDGTILPKVDRDFVIGDDGWLAAGADGRDGLATGAFSVNYAALRVVESASDQGTIMPVETPSDGGVKNIRLGSSAGAAVTHAVRTPSGQVVLAVWTSSMTNRIAGQDHEFPGGGGAVLVIASSIGALGRLVSADTAAPTCAMMSDACFTCVNEEVQDAACLGRDAVCTGQLIGAPTCACSAQNVNPDDAAAVDACFSKLANEHQAGGLTANAILETCADVCR